MFMCLSNVFEFFPLKIKILQATVLLPFQTVPGTVWLLFCSSLGHSNTYDEDVINFVKFSMKVILTVIEKISK